MNDIDVLRRFDWRNSKAMPLERFMKEFNQLSHDEQTKVLASLKNDSKRKKSVLKRIDQQSEQYLKNQIEIDIECVKEYLLGYVEGSIKNQEEAALTFAIVSNNFYLKPCVEEIDSNDNVEINSFILKKKEMLKWISKIDKRVGHNLNNQTLYDLLKDFEYVPEQSKPKLLQKKKQGWLQAYRSLGTGIVRAKNIIKGLSELLSDIDNFLKISKFIEGERTISLDELTTINEVSFKKRCKNIDSVKDIDTYTKLQLKLHALQYFVTDDMQNLGKELLKVYGGPENYSLSLDDISAKSYDELMVQEQAIFNKYNYTMPKEIEESLKETYNYAN